MIGKISNERFEQMMKALEVRIIEKVGQAYTCGALKGDEADWLVFDMVVALIGEEYKPKHLDHRAKYNNLSRFI